MLFQFKIRRLCQRMHPRVRPSGSMYFHGMSCHALQNSLQLPLYRHIRIFLRLPAFIAASVILQNDLVIFHFYFLLSSFFPVLL